MGNLDIISSGRIIITVVSSSSSQVSAASLLTPFLNL